MTLTVFPFDDPFALVPALEPGAVHLYRCSLADPRLEPLAGLCLTEEERHRAAKLKMDRIRSQFVAARSLLRNLFSGYLNLTPREVPIEYQDGGKPLLAAPHTWLHFNVSHCDNRGLFAFTRAGRIGVDLERIRPLTNLEGLVERFFAEREKKRFRLLDPSLRERAFFRAWTCKEAVLKAIGRGVQSLDCCEVAFEPGEESRVISLNGESVSEYWFLREWEPESGFLSALAVCRESGIG